MRFQALGGACVPSNPRSWCDYGRLYMRPHEIAALGLVPVVMWSAHRRAGHSVACCVSTCMKQLLGKAATCMQTQLANCALRYVRDPDHCDLWRPPSEVWHDGGGDCDDLALFAGSLALACGLAESWLAVGTSNGIGHAWVEGREGGRFFYLEGTSGELVWDARPVGLIPTLHASPIHGCFDANLARVA